MKNAHKKRRIFGVHLCPVFRVLVAVILVGTLGTEILPWGLVECAPAARGEQRGLTLRIESLQVCDRTAYAQSRMLITFEDGATVGVCSVHCAADELSMNKNKTVKSLLVADYATLELLDAKSAVGVSGSLHQDLNGLQMKTNWFMSAGLQVML